ncbi:hypothetical protein GCM10009007_20810 [Formosimonas limnophila]|uniref:Uncharacterized protein n=1 Tax=Formosimonas limnophila TaxID=1384487 RepID=A0A8J3CP72_9BURK|nr:hypothetical protein [Formosimonas limnophila]GHA79690.1 hypothetical protein GCM10009007_20810 [Formosimonas limnophila]
MDNRKKVKDIGFLGMNSIYSLGPPVDVRLFFDCIRFFVVPKYSKEDWGLVTDRLYKRYVRFEDISETKRLFEIIREEFLKISSNEINWTKDFLNGNIVTKLDLKSTTLLNLFARYFWAFDKHMEFVDFSVKSKLDYYTPIKIGRAEITWSIYENGRPLAEYDELEGEPFWNRADL